MGIIDLMDGAGQYFQNRWNDAKATFGNSWNQKFWHEGLQQFYEGALTMAQSYKPDHDSFGKGLGMFFDSFLGAGEGVLGGTIGTAFQAPLLHEGGVALDKVYRYGVAKPAAWAWSAPAIGALAADEARKHGADPLSAYLSGIVRNPFSSTEGIYSDENGKITPGQALMWSAGGIVGHIHPGNEQDPFSWLYSHDPRTDKGQAAYNGPDSAWYLKYGSGSVDMALNVVADPTPGGIMLAKAARRHFTNVATPDYIAKGGVEREISSKNYEKTYEIFRNAKTPEAARLKTMADAPLGGRAAVLLHAAAHMPDQKLAGEVFRDLYVIARRVDGLPLRPGAAPVAVGRSAEQGLSPRELAKAAEEQGLEEAPTTAWARLADRAPAIASDMVRLMANWNIGEDATNIGRVTTGSEALNSLALNDTDAFLAALASRSGPWEKIGGSLMNAAQPRPGGFMQAMSQGIHSWAMSESPIHVGRSLPRHVADAAVDLTKGAVKRAMPSQGYTAFLDAEDGTALSLRQFKANLERSGMSSQRVEQWVSAWAAKTGREGRNAVFQDSEDEALALIAKRHGLDEETVRNAMPTISQYRDASRQILQNQRVYLTDRVQRAGVRRMAVGRKAEAKEARDLSRDIAFSQRQGGFGDEATVMTNVDGHTNIVEMPSTRELSPQGANMHRPLELTQTERMIPTKDFRALDGALKWWKLAHRPENSVKGWTLAKVAKTHAAWDGLITSADFANMIWKTSALLRPAQTPRNLADDVLRRLLIFGKLPLIISAMDGTARTGVMVGARGKLRWEQFQEWRAKRGAEGTTTLKATARDSDSHAPGNVVATTDTPNVEKYTDIADAWRNGAVGLNDFVDWIGAQFKDNSSALPPELLRLFNSRERGLLAYKTARASKSSLARAASQADPYSNLFDKKAWAEEEEKKVVDKAANEREFKRRLIQMFFDNWNLDTVFLNHQRIRAVTDAQAKADPRLGKEGWDPARIHGPEGDEKYSETNYLKDTIRDLIRDHRDRRVAARYGSTRDAHTHGLLVLDPFSGNTPRDFGDNLDNYTIVRSRNMAHPIRNDGSISDTSSNTLERFIIDNVDHLLKPDHLLALAVDPRGDVRMHVVRAKPEYAARTPIKVGAKRRLENLRIEGKQDAGHQAIHITIGQGDDQRVVEFGAALGGESGEAYLHRLSARDGNGSTNYLLSDVDARRLLAQQGGWGISRPGDKGYPHSWERAVNAQMAGDEVASRLLRGATEHDVVHWIENTAEGTKYIQRMKYFGVNYVDHVRQIAARVDEYAPWNPDRTEASQTLRQAILERKATIGHLKDVRDIKGEIKATSPLPEVHGASLDYMLGKGAIFDHVAKGIDKAQQWLSDVPTDVASRIPFFAEAYRRHLNDIVRVEELNSAAMDEGSAFNAGELDRLSGKAKGSELSTTMTEETAIAAKNMRRVEDMARERALYDTKYSLYDVAQVSDLARLSRFVIPFSSAIMDSYIKYGRIIRDNPATVLQGLYYWQMFERNEAVQDENGNVLHYDASGQEKFYREDPKTGKMTLVPDSQVGKDRYVQFRLPSGLGEALGIVPGMPDLSDKSIYGTKIKPVIAINKKTFNVFLDLPAAGPMVAVPVNEFSLSHPEFSEAKSIQKFILPFGPSSDRKNAWMPSTLKTAWSVFQGEDGDKAEGQAKAIYQAELISYARGERDTAPSFSEVRSKASMLQNLRFASAWISPVSFQVQSPYQPYIDAYRQMANDPNNKGNADEAFLARYGDEFYAVAMATTRNISGVRASLASYKTYEAHKELIAAYPELAGLITGQDGGAFSKSVYEAQKEEAVRPGSPDKVRRVLSLDESVAQLEARRVWNQYSKMMDIITSAMVDRGLRTLRGSRAQDLIATRDAFVKANRTWTDPATGREVASPWFKDFSQVDHNAIDSRIDAMWQIVQDPSLQKRDDIRGLISYLSARRSMQETMAKAGVKTLDSAKAKTLATQWQDISFNLMESNAPFGAVWNRYLSTDDKLQLPTGGLN